MSRMQRNKGRRGELEVLARLNEIGGDGELLYGQEELGGKEGDVSTTHGLFEVKRRAAFPSWMKLNESVRGVYCRRDRGPWMVLVRAEDFETLVLENRRLRCGAEQLPQLSAAGSTTTKQKECDNE